MSSLAWATKARLYDPWPETRTLMNFQRADYEVIDITCLVGFKEVDDPCARRCSNLKADETGNNEGFTSGESSRQMSVCGYLR